MIAPTTYLTNGQSSVPRLHIAEAGEQLDNAIRTATNRMLADLKRVPAVAYELRRRPIGFKSLGQCLAAAARQRVPVERALAIAEAVHGFVLQIFAHGPTPPVFECWTTETREQGEADVAQGTALLTLSVGDLDRAIEATQEELGAKRQLLLSLQTQRAAAQHRRLAPFHTSPRS